MIFSSPPPLSLNGISTSIDAKNQKIKKSRNLKIEESEDRTIEKSNNQKIEKIKKS